MKKKAPMCPANAQAISRWEGEGGARKSGAEEAQDMRQALPKGEERLPMLSHLDVLGVPHSQIKVESYG